MVLQSLVKYYEILANDPESNIPKLGYSKANVSYALNISKTGELLSVIPLKIREQRGKKLVEVPQSMDVPEQFKRSGSKAPPYFLCDNLLYVLGFEGDKVSEKSIRSHNSFADYNIKNLTNVNCEESNAVISFLKNWKPESILFHEATKDIIGDLSKGGNFVFKMDGRSQFIHHNLEIQKSWEKSLSEKSNEFEGYCLVSGEKSKIARIHNSVKNIKAKSIAKNGWTLVGVDKDSLAFSSYGKLQGLNSPVSEYAAFAYTTVLNNLLSDNAHKQYIGDTTVVFWAETKGNAYKDIMSLFIDPSELETTETQETKFVRDKRAIKEVSEIFKKISQGTTIGNFSDAFDESTKFYILGLSPNNARLSVRFFINDTFGGFINKISSHYEDLKIEKQFENELDFFSLWKLLNETVSPNSNDKSASPLLAGAVLRSIISGGQYPTLLFNAVMIRIRAEQSINYYKASIIKAYLLRSKNNNKFKEVLTVSLNEQSDNRAYILGRLFAILEKAQEDASTSKLNSTIKDRYFTSACATPASVFPILLRLSQHHISKAEYGYVSDKKIASIVEKLDVENNPIPSHLSLEEQGIFVLGYYHQKNALYTKKI